MNKPVSIFAAAAFSFAAAAAGSAVAQTPTAAKKPAAAKTAAPKTAAAAPASAVCAVMGDKVANPKTATFSVYQGKKYLFCCAGCKPEFDKNPAKYVKTAAAGSATPKATKTAPKKG